MSESTTTNERPSATLKSNVGKMDGLYPGWGVFPGDDVFPGGGTVAPSATAVKARPTATLRMDIPEVS